MNNSSKSSSKNFEKLFAFKRKKKKIYKTYPCLENTKASDFLIMTIMLVGSSPGTFLKMYLLVEILVLPY